MFINISDGQTDPKVTCSGILISCINIALAIIKADIFLGHKNIILHIHLSTKSIPIKLLNYFHAGFLMLVLFKTTFSQTLNRNAIRVSHYCRAKLLANVISS